MKAIRHSAVVFWTTLALGLAQTASASCKLQELHPVGANVDVGAVHLNLGSPDNADKPTAWEGPMVVSRQNHASCTVKDNVAIISSPLMLGNERFLYVPTYSGSESIFYIIDTQDCSIRWQSHAYSGDAVFKKNSINLHDAGHVQLGPQCLPESGAAPSAPAVSPRSAGSSTRSA